VKDEEELRYRFPPIGMLTAFVITVLCIGAIVFVHERWPGIMNMGAAECTASYHSARSASDTAMIDEQRPSAQKANKPNSETCGYWRKVGLTR
jgi:hypothetical protein